MVARALVEKLIYGHELVGRFTQDSPILPDVWIECARDLRSRHDLLITPYLEASGRMTAGRLSVELRQRLALEAQTPVWRRLHPQEKHPAASVAYNQSTVAASLTFAEMVRVVLPLSKWWLDRVLRQGHEPLQQALTEPAGQAMLAEILAYPQRRHERHARARELPWWSPDIVWMVRVIGTLSLAAAAPAPAASDPNGERQVQESVWPPDLLDRPVPAEEPSALRARRLAYYQSVVRHLAALVEGILPSDSGRASVFCVSRNRRAGTAIWRSSMAVKADAARRVFGLSCRDLAWAVVDSGIDARHPAFRRRYHQRALGRSLPVPLPASVAEESPDTQSHGLHAEWRKANPGQVRREDWTDRTRVVATYDFTLIRHLLAADGADKASLPEALRQRLAAVEKRLRKRQQASLSSELRASLQAGRDIDWSLLEELIRVPHDAAYEVPRHEHGTHVAGILGADWRMTDGDELFPAAQDVGGLCPEISLYDLRVLDQNGQGDEFNIMAALQFVRSLNAHKDYLVVHGVNLSLSIPHDVANYACGRTPVCEECERLVGAGIVVVAAAGNEGYLQYVTAKGLTEGYRSISITDPGNGDGVITVGSTHRDQPHTYGVSYFSSRGPTGDGRVKPDLVAPGEKIESVVPHRALKRLDGTSMAAPHVSGAAALLIARHRELAGQPRRIKETLCRSATDLGRERYFQGAGMLDILRALQSV